ncbi:MAG: T9SS type A sorting domain-containing protein [Bacteroidota bacterium]
MKRILFILLLTICYTTTFYAQMNPLADPALNEVVQTPTIAQNIGETATICVTVTNAGNDPIPANVVLVTVSWSSIYEFQGDNNVASQGWTIIQSSPQSATFRNTTDDIDPILETKDLCIDVIAVALGSDLILANISIAPGSTNMVGNAQTANDNVQNAQGVLPVEFTSFTGKSIDCQAELSWTTASETNNERFELQHSENAKDFKEIAKIKGAGTTLTPQQYSFTHETAAIGTNYYRIKQVDTDGASDYSAVIAVENDCKPAEDIFTVYPNPLGDQDLTIIYEVHQEHEAEIEVLNLVGEQVLRVPIAAEQGRNRFSLRTAPLAAGTYYVSLYKNGVKVKTEKIMKMME